MTARRICSLYVIGPDKGGQKIGVANDPVRRCADLQIANPHVLRIHHSIRMFREDAYALEAKIKSAFGRVRIHGEWFEIHPSDAVLAIQREAQSYRRPSEEGGYIGRDPWQLRARRAGLNQRTIAVLLGLAENTVSLQLRGKWKSGVPLYIKTFIRSWEMLTADQRDELLASALSENASDDNAAARSAHMA